MIEKEFSHHKLHHHVDYALVPTALGRAFIESPDTTDPNIFHQDRDVKIFHRVVKFSVNICGIALRKVGDSILDLGFSGGSQFLDLFFQFFFVLGIEYDIDPSLSLFFVHRKPNPV
jgi:hypothetical protein